MTDESAPGTHLLRFALEGERVKRAAAIFERESPRLGVALRRAVPFLGRRGVPVTLSYARTVPVAELLEGLPRPIHVTHLVPSPGGARGAMLLDAGAIAMFLEGVLGGDGRVLPELNPAGLSAPQAALMSGLATAIVKGFSDALWPSLGVRLECRAPETEEATAEAAPVACVLEFGAETVGRAILLLPKEILLATSSQPEPASPPPADPCIVAVLAGVELTLVAELGRMQMKLRDLTNLKVGDTINLNVPVSGTVSVRANGRELLRGRPTTSGGQIAVKITRGHEA